MEHFRVSLGKRPGRGLGNLPLAWLGTGGFRSCGMAFNLTIGIGCLAMGRPSDAWFGTGGLRSGGMAFTLTG